MVQFAGIFQHIMHSVPVDCRFFSQVVTFAFQRVKCVVARNRLGKKKAKWEGAVLATFVFLTTSKRECEKIPTTEIG